MGFLWNSVIEAYRLNLEKGISYEETGNRWYWGNHWFMSDRSWDEYKSQYGRFLYTWISKFIGGVPSPLIYDKGSIVFARPFR